MATASRSDVRSLWNATYAALEDHLSGQERSTWFAPVTPRSVERSGTDLTLVLSLPSTFYVDWHRRHYEKRIAQAAADVSGEVVRIRYEAGESAAQDEPEPARPTARTREADAAPAPPSGASRGPRRRLQRDPAPPASAEPLLSVDSPALRPDYTFDTFVQGDCNQLAYSAARAIAADPDSAPYNPLLVYGGVGLGKTHLVQAIGHAVLNGPKRRNVVYTTSETFTSQFVQSIQMNRVAAFSSFYREVDVLIVDDVQFFGGKEKTQEEFFHIFNTLHQAGKCIILCADRAPKEISGIEERLLSRFRWGLTADVQAPDLETRIAILYRKARQLGITVPEEVTHYIAERVTCNIRTLEGALNRLVAFNRLESSDFSLDAARHVLGDVLDEPMKAITLPTIREAVAAHFGLHEHQLIDRSRKQRIAFARQIAMYLAKKLTDETYKEIGLRFGGRDHSTVVYAYQKIADLIDNDTTLQRDLSAIERALAQ